MTIEPIRLEKSLELFGHRPESVRMIAGNVLAVEFANHRPIMLNTAPLLRAADGDTEKLHQLAHDSILKLKGDLRA